VATEDEDAVTGEEWSTRNGEQIRIPLRTVEASNMETGKKILLQKPDGSSFNAHTLFLQIN